jgi:hypothetical protein
VRERLWKRQREPTHRPLSFETTVEVVDGSLVSVLYLFLFVAVDWPRGQGTDQRSTAGTGTGTSFYLTLVVTVDSTSDSQKVSKEDPVT